MAERVDLAAGGALGGAAPEAVIVAKVDYDDHGLPRFDGVLKKRPTKAGERFSLVHYEGGRPEYSCDIAITKQSPDMKRPLRVIYEWTGKGFKVGAVLALAQAGYYNPAGEESHAADMKTEKSLHASAGALLLGSAGGFAIGLVSFLPSAIKEMSRLVLNKKETVLGFSSYEYDENGRLARMRTFAPDGVPTELVRTDYSYAGESAVPCNTEVTSHPEKRTRTVQ